MTVKARFSKILLCLFFSCLLPMGGHATAEKRIILIDPGHGGKDPGAIARKVREKNVVLSLSKKIADRLQKKGGEVHLTRRGDRFVSLEGRNRVANQKQCDLFLSIHANTARNRKANGIELYYLNKATDAASQKLAARENAALDRKKGDVDAILSDLLQTAVTEESAEAAQVIQKALTRRLKRYRMTPVKIKTALFYVLVGAKCPSLLIESGYLTHPEEARRLQNRDYQSHFAEAIAEGVWQYFLKEGKGGDL